MRQLVAWILFVIPVFSDKDCRTVDRHIKEMKDISKFNFILFSYGERTPVRLSGGDVPHEGRVEVYYNGTWGTICDDAFDELDAAVICSMLNYPTSEARVEGEAFFGNGTGTMWLDEVNCDGTEADIAYCKNSGWGNVNCDHTEDVSVLCSVMTSIIRLVGGGVPYEGRLEVYHDGKWGTVCNDFFDSREAVVVCRMLHFPTRNAIAKSRTAFGQGTGEIWLDDMNCIGNETAITNCEHDEWGMNNCGHSEDISVFCEVPHYPNETVRLVNGNSSSEGRVLIFHDNQWGTVCDDFFDINAAMVVCRMLGLPSAGAKPMDNAFYGQGSGVIWLDDVICEGTELDIDSCNHRQWGVSYCDHSEDVGVYCDEGNMHTPLRLSDGYGQHVGRVEVYYNGTWGTLCDDAFDANDAAVVCRMLNFPSNGAMAIGQSYFGNGTGDIWFDEMDCGGNEPDIAYCRHNGWGNVHCNHSQDASVICQVVSSTVRLVGGRGPYEGRLEIYHDGIWGTVCNNFFDLRDAAVVCRMLSFPTREASSGPDFGQGTGQIWLDNVDCVGNETDIANCWHDDWGTSSCSHSEDASVICQVPQYPNETVRLVNGNSSSEGRVEIFHDNQWGTVCDDFFDINAAMVVCSMLGLPSTDAKPRNNSFFGEGVGVIWLDDVICNGLESDLGSCNHGNWGVSDCDHLEDVGVECGGDHSPTAPVEEDRICFQTASMDTKCYDPSAPKAMEHTLVRLADGTGPHEGRVEIYFNGTWGTICDTNFNTSDAAVICRMLNYPVDGAIAKGDSHFGTGTGRVWLDRLGCTGVEPDIAYCQHSDWGNTSCDLTGTLSVICQYDITYTPVRLVGGNGSYEGRVEIFHEGIWGTICDRYFIDENAAVICRMLSYDTDGVVVKKSAAFGAGTGEILYYADCDGDELDLGDCRFSGWGKRSCTHENDTSLVCPVKRHIVRLANGTAPTNGRVEVLYGEQWGTVCDDLFDSDTASVICAILGLQRYGVQVVNSSVFGEGSGVIWMDDLSCDRIESDIRGCHHNGWGISNCDHSEDVGVICSEVIQPFPKEFQPSICSQDDVMDIECEEIANYTDDNVVESKWPPGRYALPMSVYGCPEDSSRGWQEGYLLVKFKNDFFTSKPYMPTENVTESGEFVWPDLNRFVFTPFSTDTFEMHFCVKTRHSAILDTGRFPAGNYSIFADESGCKDVPGAQVTTLNITLPVLDHWEVDGQLPNLFIHEFEDQAILVLVLCRKSVYQPGVQAPLYPSEESDIPFAVIQNDDSTCPTFGKRAGQLVTEDTVMYTRTADNNMAIWRSITYCCNQPMAWKKPNKNLLFTKRVEQAFVLSSIYVIYGNNSQDTLSTAAIGESVSAFRTFQNLLEDHVYLQWKVIDLGRMYAISSVRIHLKQSNTINTGSIQGPHCFVSQGKWAFLYYRALKCPIALQYNTEDQLVHLLFIRSMKGRYLALVDRPDDPVLGISSYMEVFTNRINYEESDGCNLDIGIMSGRVNNSQITASSFNGNFYPWEARPYLRGWCAAADDSNPYIMVDLISSTRLEGVSVWPWKISGKTNENVAFSKMVALGVVEFTISYSENQTNFTAYGLNFVVEKYRQNDEQSTFWFLKPFTARYLRLHVIRPYTAGLNCLKFELHGCLGTVTELSVFREDELVTNVQYVYGLGYLTSPDFPMVYINGMKYEWVIIADKDSFATLLFTNISLFEQNTLSTNNCTDRVLISRYITQKDLATKVDHRLNGEVFMLETKEPVVFVSFITCVLSEKRESGKTGFRAIVNNKRIPTCFSIDNKDLLETERQETCILPSMSLKSMSYQGLKVIGTTEEWTILSARKRIKMLIKDFRVPCQKDGYGSEFRIAEPGVYDRAYCNLNRPTDVYYSKSDTVTVTFRKNEEQPLIRYTAGFWIEYTVIETSLEHLIDSQAFFSRVVNVAINKPADMSSQDANTPELASYGNDDSGVGFQTVDYESPWWRVDLQDIYRLEFAVLKFRPLYGSEKSHLWQRYLKIYTGFEEQSLEATQYYCGQSLKEETIPLHSIHTRYFKMERTHPYEQTFRLQEIEIYGEEDHNVNQTRRDFYIRRTIEKGECAGSEKGNGDYGSWSAWSACSVRCGIGVKERKRECLKDPDTPCLGEDTDIQKCIGNGSCPVCIRKFKKCYSFFPELTNWEHAGFECWRRHMRLVSINSLEELQFIKYKLRDRRLLSVRLIVHKATERFNASYFAHIGLHRTDARYADNQFFWEDLSPLTYNAWKTGEPKAGRCVKMNYQFYEPNNTWETIDCKLGLADFFVCEKLIKDGDDDFAVLEESTARYPQYGEGWRYIYEHLRTADYRGTENITRNGKPCLSWQGRGLNRWFNWGEHEKQKNYCRDPNQSGAVWCYIDSEWHGDSESCDILMPEMKDNSTSFMTYTGELRTSYAGRECATWSYGDTDFRGEKTDEAFNYCRDPFGYGYLWCFTVDPNYEWEPCILPDTSTTKRCEDVIITYQGELSYSFSGKNCSRWDSFGLNLTGDGRVPAFADGDISGAENYCRDPFGDGYVWCFTDPEGELWEPCNINEDEGAYAFQAENDSGGAEFHCDNGEVIPLINKCDGKINCADLTDETSCWKLHANHKLFQTTYIQMYWPATLEPSSYFQCGSLEWISVLARCDHIIDCADASDEMGCQQDSEDVGNCNEAQYQCNNGECISGDLRCDGVTHCSDGTDEGNCDACNTAMAFHCDVVMCIARRLVCDTYVDCEDGADEYNCYTEGFTSCQQYWDAGHRKAGIYNIRGLSVTCDFDSVSSRNRLYAYIKNIDLYWTTFSASQAPGHSYRAYTYTRAGFETADSDLVAVLKSSGSCLKQTEQTCSPVHSAIMEFDVAFYEKTFGVCSCETRAVRCHFGCQLDICEIAPHTTVFEDTGTNMEALMMVSFDNVYTDYFEVITRPITCTYKFNPKSINLVCQGDVKVIPSYLKCLYDVSSAGVIQGCRSASHLEGCGAYECMPNTVKCPGSYCIPLRFVCDGEKQCPSGEDEDDCRCDLEDIEVVVVVDRFFLSKYSTIVHGFAKQFSTDKSIVRILSYETGSALLNFGIISTILRISDTHILPFSAVNRHDVCQYKVMTDRFLSTLKFSKAKTRGVIFMETTNEAALVSKALFSKSGKASNLGTHLYRVIQRPGMVYGFSNTFSNVVDVAVPNWKILTDVGAAYFPELCSTRTKTNCSNGYRCLSSRICISLSEVCDGERQCIHGDDEQLCEFVCPVNCTCTGFAVNCRNQNLEIDNIETFPLKTRQLDISLNPHLSLILQSPTLDMKFLVRLNVSHCNITAIREASFFNIYNLKVLDLSYNRFRMLNNDVFGRLGHLTDLYMHGSFELVTVEAGSFKGLSNVQDLRLVGTKLQKIAAYTFSGMTLRSLDFSNNSISIIENFAFDGLSAEVINFESNPVKDLNRKIFVGVRDVRKLITSAYKFCCIRPTYLVEGDCSPPKDEFSSCEDLMRLSALQTMLWLVGASALLGNFLSIVFRLKYDRERLKLGYGIFVTNLALADFIMGVYLIIIAIADAVYRKRYIFEDEYWRNSAWCTFAGILSTVSSEASVLFLCLITLDRLFVIKFPFGQIRFNSSKAHICSVSAWCVCLFIALVPIFFESYFQNKFYSRSGVCIALPLTKDRAPGWLYSVVIFIGLNFITFVLVAFGQFSIFMEVRKSSSRMRKMQSARRKDLTVARNLLLVVTTDFLCWFPIGVMGMMALNGQAISGDVYAWTAVFILPVNSALNPVLYTLSAIIGKSKFNPSNEEQNRTELSTVIGNYLRQYQSVSSLFNVRGTSKRGNKITTSLSMSVGELEVQDGLKLAYKLVRCLDVLHGASLVIGNLDKNNVFVVERNGKLTGNLRLRAEPVVANKDDDLRKDILQTGRIVNLIIQKCQKPKQSE